MMMMMNSYQLAQVYLRIKWKVKQFEVFHERSFQSMTLYCERLPRGDVIDYSAHNALLRVAGCVVDVDHWIPVLTPVNCFRNLCNKQNKSTVNLTLAQNNQRFTTENKTKSQKPRNVPYYCDTSLCTKTIKIVHCHFTKVQRKCAYFIVYILKYFDSK